MQKMSNGSVLLALFTVFAYSLYGCGDKASKAQADKKYGVLLYVDLSIETCARVDCDQFLSFGQSEIDTVALDKQIADLIKSYMAKNISTTDSNLDVRAQLYLPGDLALCMNRFGLFYSGKTGYFYNENLRKLVFDLIKRKPDSARFASTAQ